MTPTARARRERGSVTAELAVALPVVVVLLLAVLTVGSAAVAQLRAVDAARAAARAAALGEGTDVVAQVASRVGGGAARVTVDQDGTWVDVEVSVPVVGRLSGGLVARSTASARVEP